MTNKEYTHTHTHIYIYIYICMAVMSFKKKSNDGELAPYHAQIYFGIKEDIIFP